MKELIAVFIGSGLGGLSRFGLGKWINPHRPRLQRGCNGASSVTQKRVL